jgi:protein-serine/threonine kinase
MKRGRTKNIVLQDDKQPALDGVQDDMAVPPLRITPRNTFPLTPPASPEREARPSKLRRHGSKILTVLRSMSNYCAWPSRRYKLILADPILVASQGSITEENVPDSKQSTPTGLGKKISMAMVKGQLDPTIVHRAQLKPSRAVVIPVNKEDLVPTVVENVPGSSPTSPSTSGGDSTSTGRKSSVPGPGLSTGKTSLDSKWSSKHNAVSNSAHSSENKKSVGKHTIAEVVHENILSSIAEAETSAAETPSPSKYSKVHHVKPLS